MSDIHIALDSSYPDSTMARILRLQREIHGNSRPKNSQMRNTRGSILSCLSFNDEARCSLPLRGVFGYDWWELFRA